MPEYRSASNLVSIPSSTSTLMPLWKKKPETQIPPVAPPAALASGGSSFRSSASTYVASRDGDQYSQQTQYSQQQQPAYGGGAQGGYGDSQPYADRYSRNKPIGDVYSRGGGQVDADRSELFSGYRPSPGGSGRFFDGPDAGAPPPAGQETEEDVEGIKKQTRYVKQESVNSTRNALRMAREAEDTARGTLSRLGDQSEKLANTERHLDVAKGHNQRAADKTDELKQLNKSIFRPVVTWNKDGKRAAQEAKVQARYEEEREEREKAMMDIRDSQARIGQAQTYGRGRDGEELVGGSGRFKTAEQLSSRKEQRKRYQFEATASDDEIEDELDDNLGEISEATKRLKALGLAMGSELDNQNARIDRIEGKTVNLDSKIFANTERLKKIK